jgi:outer membrane protein
MKNISLIVNIVLAVGLGIMLILFFSLRSKVNSLETQPSVPGISGSGRVVYVNMDTLYSKYDKSIDVKAKLLDDQKKAEAEFAAKKNSFDKSASDYQDKMQKGLLLRSEAAKIEQQLSEEQQRLYKLSQDMQSNLADESQVQNRKLFNDIVSYVKEYNKNGKYQYILSHSYGGNLLYASDSLDITKEILKGLNDQYSSEKKK